MTTPLKLRLGFFAYTTVLVAGTTLLSPWFGIGAIATSGANVVALLWKRRPPG
jgi:hypothetical protein